MWSDKVRAGRFQWKTGSENGSRFKI